MGIICQSSGVREQILCLTLHWQGEMPQHWAAPKSGASRRDQTCNMLEERKQKRGKKNPLCRFWAVAAIHMGYEHYRQAILNLKMSTRRWKEKISSLFGANAMSFSTREPLGMSRWQRYSLEMKIMKRRMDLLFLFLDFTKGWPVKIMATQHWNDPRSLSDKSWLNIFSLGYIRKYELATLAPARLMAHWQGKNNSQVELIKGEKGESVNVVSFCHFHQSD